MNQTHERRAFRRHRCEARLQVSYFNQEAAYAARMVNFSEGGICLLSSVSLKPGTTILIRFQDDLTQSPCQLNMPGLRTISLSQIKWCKELADGNFKIGAQYIFRC